jgi:ribosomal protein S12 methylthiotransferase accessory factor
MNTHGKDAAPQETIAKIRRVLTENGFSLEEVSWRHPAPHMWSVHVRDRHVRAFSVNGKGLTRALALASACGEFMERLVTGYFFSDYAVPIALPKKKFYISPDEKWFPLKSKSIPRGLLSPRLISLYDPLNELGAFDLLDRMFLTHPTEAAICALPFQRTCDAQRVYFPLSVLDNLYASNGMAAGNTKKEACVQALSEILERFVKKTVISRGIALADIPLKRYRHLRNMCQTIAAIRGAGYSVRVKDASLGGRYPVVNVTLIEKRTRASFLAFGAHPSFDIALERAVSELLQGQSLSAFKGLYTPSANTKEVRDPANLITHFIDSSGRVARDFFQAKPAYPFTPFDCVGTRQDEEEYLLKIFRRAKKDVYIHAIDIQGFSVCRIVVPGWSEVYPPEELVYANTNKGRPFYKPLMSVHQAAPARLKEIVRLIDRGSVGEQEIIADVLGLVFDRSSPWQRLCFGELKLLVLLKLKERERARSQLQWCLDVQCARPAMHRVYECLAALVDGESRPRFPATVRARAEKLLCAQDVFSGLFTKSGSPRGLRAHQKIVKTFLASRAMKTPRGRL